MHRGTAMASLALLLDCPLRIADTEEAAGEVIASDGNNQLARGAGLPDEITLKIGKHHLTKLDFGEQLFESAMVGHFKQAQSTGSYFFE